MSKSLTLMILIVLIAYSLSFIPINDNLIDFSFIDGFLDKTEEPAPVEVAYGYVFESDAPRVLTNPGEIAFHWTTDHMYYPLTTDLLVEIHQEDSLVKSYGKEILVASSSETREDSLIHLGVLSLSFKDMGLAPGSYEARVIPQDQAFKDQVLTFELNYTGEYPYVEAVEAPPAGKQFITLFFADEGINYLFPVNRAIDVTDQLIRTTLRNLEEGPAPSLGLYEKSVAPYSSRAFLEDDIVTLYFTSQEVAPYDQGSTASTFAIDALTHTMSGIPYINGLKILVNASNPGSDYFHGLSLEDTLTPLDWPTAYLGFETATGRVLLNPAKSQNLTEESLFQALKGAHEDLTAYYDHPDTLLPLPESLELSSWVMEGNTILLNIEGDLDPHFHGREQNFTFMIDALVTSYTTLPGIDRVKLNFLSEETDAPYGHDLSEALGPKSYLNVE
jgi:hypothetical protein